jgi:catechol 2,3-dioxygenase-like lactoylglutathione lyase family enzyme
MKGLTGIGHVAIRVRDVARALEFYRGGLGFAEILRLHRDDGRLWLIYLRITDDQFLEMLTDKYLEGIPADSRVARGGALRREFLSENNLARIRCLDGIANAATRAWRRWRSPGC